MIYGKNVSSQNCSLQKDLQIFSDIVSDKTYIFNFNLKNTFKVQKFNFSNKMCDIRKNVKMEIYWPKWGLQILNRPFFDKMFILCFDFKTHYWKSKIQFFNQNIYYLYRQKKILKTPFTVSIVEKIFFTVESVDFHCFNSEIWLIHSNLFLAMFISQISLKISKFWLIRIKRIQSKDL